MGIGGNNTCALTDTIKNTDLSGYDAILTVSPYYNKPTQEGIHQHYKAVSQLLIYQLFYIMFLDGPE